MKLWEGKYHKEPDKRTDDFNSSFSFDKRLWREDIEGSIAHATMLGECGIIAESDAIAIVSGLKGIYSDIESGSLPLESDAEDIHSFVEGELTKRIGEAGKRLHTARSRNDQVALDLRMYCRRKIAEVRASLRAFLTVLADTAEKNLDALMPGYTHLQRAQPVTYAHVLTAYAQMLMRDENRLTDCEKRTDCMPLGSGALAATTYPIDRERVARLLGFSSITANSLDGVSDRDFVLELSSALSLIMVHLSRMSEESILWCSGEFGFLRLDDAFSTGSSIMPQKKNPDIAELIRGKTGRVFGDMTTLFTMMKGLPLAYNKDMQEDKEAIFDALDNTLACLEIFTAMLPTFRVERERMLVSAKEGLLNATDVADYLVKKGMPFRTAYRVTGDLVALCTETGRSLDQITLEEYRSFSELFDKDIYACIDLLTCVSDRGVPGGPAPDAVRKQIDDLRAFLSSSGNG